MAREPNFHAHHPDYPHTVDIHVADSHIKKLESPDPRVSAGAEASIAIKFREESTAQHFMVGTYVTPEVELRRIDRSDDPMYGEPPVRMGPGGVVLDDE